MRLFLFNQNDPFKNQRFIWQHEQAPESSEEEDIDRALESLEKRVIERKKWGSGSSELDDWKEKVAAGEESSYSPEQREQIDPHGPINPTPEILNSIREKLALIYDKVFPKRYASIFSNEVSKKYVKILRDIPEAILLQAITENGSEEALLKRFRQQLEILRDNTESSNIPTEVWNYIKDFFRWLTSSKEWDLQGENPHVQEGPIKPRHKTAIANELQKLEKYYKERLHEKYGHWWRYNDYDVQRGKTDYFSDFLEEAELPFYREFYLNKAIIDKTEPLPLAESYSKFLKRVFRECIEDEANKIKQAAEDDSPNEKHERQRSAEWTNAVRAIVEHTSH